MRCRRFVIALYVCLAGVGVNSCHTARAETARVYIAADDHTDLWWSGTEAQYQQAFIDTLDYYLDLAEVTAANPPAYQSRWNCDGSYWLWTYQKSKSAEQFQRLIDHIQSGHISVPLNALCVSLGGAPAEAVLRGMYYPGQIERRYGVRFELAYMIENQTQPFGLASLWAGAGARYSWKGICGCDSRVPDAWDREHEIYRALGPDGNGVLMKWYSMLIDNRNIGGYAEARNPAVSVDTVTVDALANGFAARYPYGVIGVFGKGWDDFQTMTDEFVQVAMATSNASRQVIVSNELDFFQDFEATYDVASLPAQACTFGNEWDLYCATMAEVSARVKRSLEKLRGAEAMAAVVSLFDTDFMTGRETARDQAWMNLGLYWEHDFGMAGFSSGHPWVAGRIAWQRRLVEEIESYVGLLYDDALVALADLISTASSTPRFYVFNPLGWSRTDVADLPWSDTLPVHVTDVLTGTEVPSQLVSLESGQHLRILASDVPSVGYRIYQINAGPGLAFSQAATTNESQIENARYRITVAERGAITSMVDKLRGDRELVQAIGGRSANDLGPSAGTLAVENAGPVSVTIRAQAPSPLQHTTRVTLIRDSDRIEIANHITENFNETHSWAFPFALTSPDVRHEEVGAVVHARRLAEGGHYASRAARYDWLTLNHFADMTGDDQVGVTLSNADCYFFQLGTSTASSLDTQTPLLSVLAGGRVANGTAGIVNQAGDTSFLQRFALRSHDGYDQAAAMRFAMEHQNPFVCSIISGGQAALPADVYSAVSLSNLDVLLWALKPAEDGSDSGLIARLWNLADAPRTTTLQLAPRSVADATRTTHIETDLSDSPVSTDGLTIELAQQEIQTYRLVLQPTPVAQPGDFNGDGIVDLADFTVFAATATGPSAPLTQTADLGGDGYAVELLTAPMGEPASTPVSATTDLDGDGDSDLADFAIFAASFSGP